LGAWETITFECSSWEKTKNENMKTWKPAWKLRVCVNEENTPSPMYLYLCSNVRCSPRGKIEEKIKVSYRPSAARPENRSSTLIRREIGGKYRTWFPTKAEKPGCRHESCSKNMTCPGRGILDWIGLDGVYIQSGLPGRKSYDIIFVLSSVTAFIFSYTEEIILASAF